MDISFTNLGTRAVTITRLTISIASVTAPNATAHFACPVSNFAITQIDPSLVMVLAGSATKSLSGTNAAGSAWPAIKMIEVGTNQDGCKGADLVLAFTAQGNNP
jgi:hypothetical protein